MRKFLLTLVAIVLWVVLVVGGLAITYNEIFLVEDENGKTTFDCLTDDWNGFVSAPFYYFGGEETTPPAETPGEETPGDEVPGDEVPGDETPGEETPGDEVSGDGTVTE